MDGTTTEETRSVEREASCYYRGVVFSPYHSPPPLSLSLSLSLCLSSSSSYSVALGESIHIKPCRNVGKSAVVYATERMQVDAHDGVSPYHLYSARSFVGLSKVLFTDRRVYQSGLRTPRYPFTYTSAIHTRPRPTSEIIFRVIFRAQTKLEWMQNARK